MVNFPVALIIIFIFFIFVFHRQIKDLFPRLKAIGQKGVILDLGQQEVASELNPRVEAERLMKALDSELVREAEEMISTELRNKKLLGSEGIPVLIRYLAVMNINYNFSEIYRIIWGSQINLLEYLNCNQNQPVKSLEAFYNSGLALYPLYYKNYSFAQWLGFLKQQLLIREDNGLVNITVKGREFLTYLTKTGLSKNKDG